METSVMNPVQDLASDNAIVANILNSIRSLGLSKTTAEKSFYFMPPKMVDKEKNFVAHNWGESDVEQFNHLGKYIEKRGCLVLKLAFEYSDTNKETGKRIISETSGSFEVTARKTFNSDDYVINAKPIRQSKLADVSKLSLN